MAKQAIVKVTYEELADALELPPGTRIVLVSGEAYASQNYIGLKVEHPDYPDTLEGNMLPVYALEDVPQRPRWR